mmetsp:Transcript_36257/g.102467  ORF Transcript_36257/g.102467 Transcript_36257/m.102467 type:complete len:205 (+) Transcript_36257:1080-1694(+)
MAQQAGPRPGGRRAARALALPPAQAPAIPPPGTPGAPHRAAAGPPAVRQAGPSPRACLTARGGLLPPPRPVAQRLRGQRGPTAADPRPPAVGAASTPRRMCSRNASTKGRRRWSAQEGPSRRQAPGNPQGVPPPPARRALTMGVLAPGAAAWRGREGAVPWTSPRRRAAKARSRPAAATAGRTARAAARGAAASWFRRPRTSRL